MAFGKKPGPPKSELPKPEPAKPIMSEANLQALEALGVPKKPQVADEKIAHRLIPAELFDPNTQEGRFLAAIGVSLNDASNVVLTDEAYIEIYKREHHLLMDIVGRTNVNMPDGVNVWPLVLVPEECWNGPFGDFLLKQLRLTPFGAWNVLVLPKDDRSAMELGMRKHPGPMGEGSIPKVNGMIGQIAQKVRAVNDAIHGEMTNGGKPDILQSLEADNSARAEMRKLALLIGRQAVGEDTLIRSLKRFHTKSQTPQPAGA